MRAPLVTLSVALIVAASSAACSSSDDGTTAADAGAAADDPKSGGAGTNFDTSRDAFNKPLANLAGGRRDDFFLGNAIFNRGWVTAPASVVDFDGLGPLFNATNCSACHFKDGRGRPPEEPNEKLLSMLVRISLPGVGEHGGVVPDPVYGDQLQEQSILGVPKEGSTRVTYTERAGAFADGEAFSLRVPTYVIEELGYGPLGEGILMSPRTAPALAGLGLLEAIPEATLLALADPDDANHDGISGRPNHVWDAAKQTTVIGRFGWKANQPTIKQQDAGAFLGDMGITSTLFGSETCSSKQAECASSATGPTPQLRPDIGGQVDYYVATLGVPGRRDFDKPEVVRGRDLFLKSGCGGCHTPTLQTGDSAEFPETAHQTIHPYTDLLLHDMGPDLADDRPDFEASGTEWRTPPLWGIGLVYNVNRHRYFMHDGRARGFAEAILWHGGEASSSTAAFIAMPRPDRDALVAFLDSL
ncbi:MAG: di-heme oxidoredictase family protein [Labilithrix sp.]